MIKKQAANGNAQALMPPIILVGNKCDESSTRDVTTTFGEALAREWGCAFMEVGFLFFLFLNLDFMIKTIISRAFIRFGFNC